GSAGRAGRWRRPTRRRPTRGWRGQPSAAGADGGRPSVLLSLQDQRGRSGDQPAAAGFVSADLPIRGESRVRIGVGVAQLLSDLGIVGCAERPPVHRQIVAAGALVRRLAVAVDDAATGALLAALGMLAGALLAGLVPAQC